MLLGEVASSPLARDGADRRREQGADDHARPRPTPRSRRTATRPAVRLPRLLHRPVPGDGDGEVRPKRLKASRRSRSSATSGTPTRSGSPTTSSPSSRSSAARSSTTRATRRATRTSRRSSPPSRRKEPEAIYVPGYYTDVALIARQARELGMKVPLLGGDGWDSAKLYEIGGDGDRGLLLLEPLLARRPLARASRSSSSATRRASARCPTRWRRSATTPRMVAVDAMKRAPGPLRRRPSATRIAATKDFPGVTGVITIDDERNAVKPAVVLEVENGRREVGRDDRAREAGRRADAVAAARRLRRARDRVPPAPRQRPLARDHLRPRSRSATRWSTAC